MIQVSGLGRSYATRTGPRRVLHGLNLEVGAGELVCIVGRSGVGKTTLLHILAGLDRRFEGSVRVAGEAVEDLTDAGLARFRGTAVGVVFQNLGVLDHLTVRDNVALPSAFGRGAGVEPAQRVDDLLERVGLAGRGDDRPLEMSGGERQRVVLARALFPGPRVLLCDEMTGQLDSDTASEVLELVSELRREFGLTVIAVTHHDDFERQADRVLRLVEGSLEPAEAPA